MLNAAFLLDKLISANYNFFTGVPCSIQAALFNTFDQYSNIQYIPATHEGEAVSIALGSCLAGKTPAVLSQNVGLGDMILPLLVSRKMGVPLLLILSWRGVGSLNSEDLLGRTTESLLKLLELPYEIISSDAKEIEVEEIIKKALKARTNKRSFVILIQPNTFITTERKEVPPFQEAASCLNNTVVHSEKQATQNLKSRHQIIEWLGDQNENKKALFLAPEGNCTKELFSLRDSCQNLYLCPLGYVSSIGLGIALNTTKKVIALDGDGSIIMRLNNLSTVGYCRPSNFIHILFNNFIYDTTGGQPSVFQSVNLPHLVQAARYKTLYLCNNFENFQKAFTDCLVQTGPHFLYTEVRPSSVPFSSIEQTPYFYAQRFKEALNNETR